MQLDGCSSRRAARRSRGWWWRLTGKAVHGPAAPSEMSSCTRNPLPIEQGHLLVSVANRGTSLAMCRSPCHHPAPGHLLTTGKASLWKRLRCAFACSVLPCLGLLWSLGDVCLPGLSPARRGAGVWRRPRCLRTHPALKMELR